MLVFAGVLCRFERRLVLPATLSAKSAIPDNKSYQELRLTAYRFKMRFCYSRRSESMEKVACFPIKYDRAKGVFPLVSMAILEAAGLAEGRSE